MGITDAPPPPNADAKADTTQVNFYLGKDDDGQNVHGQAKKNSKGHPAKTHHVHLHRDRNHHEHKGAVANRTAETTETTDKQKTNGVIARGLGSGPTKSGQSYRTKEQDALSKWNVDEALLTAMLTGGKPDGKPLSIGFLATPGAASEAQLKPAGKPVVVPAALQGENRLAPVPSPSFLPAVDIVRSSEPLVRTALLTNGSVRSDATPRPLVAAPQLAEATPAVEPVPAHPLRLIVGDAPPAIPAPQLAQATRAAEQVPAGAHPTRLTVGDAAPIIAAPQASGSDEKFAGDTVKKSSDLTLFLQSIKKEMDSPNFLANPTQVDMVLKRLNDQLALSNADAKVYNNPDKPLPPTSNQQLKASEDQLKNAPTNLKELTAYVALRDALVTGSNDPQRLAAMAVTGLAATKEAGQDQNAKQWVQDTLNPLAQQLATKYPELSAKIQTGLDKGASPEEILKSVSAEAAAAVATTHEAPQRLVVGPQPEAPVINDADKPARLAVGEAPAEGPQKGPQTVLQAANSFDDWMNGLETRYKGHHDQSASLIKELKDKYAELGKNPYVTGERLPPGDANEKASGTMHTAPAVVQGKIAQISYEAALNSNDPAQQTALMTQGIVAERLARQDRDSDHKVAPFLLKVDLIRDRLSSVGDPNQASGDDYRRVVNWSKALADAAKDKDVVAERTRSETALGWGDSNNLANPRAMQYLLAKQLFDRLTAGGELHMAHNQADSNLWGDSTNPSNPQAGNYKTVRTAMNSIIDESFIASVPGFDSPEKRQLLSSTLTDLDSRVDKIAQNAAHGDASQVAGLKSGTIEAFKEIADLVNSSSDEKKKYTELVAKLDQKDPGAAKAAKDQLLGDTSNPYHILGNDDVRQILNLSIKNNVGFDVLQAYETRHDPDSPVSKHAEAVLRGLATVDPKVLKDALTTVENPALKDKAIRDWGQSQDIRAVLQFDEVRKLAALSVQEQHVDRSTAATGDKPVIGLNNILDWSLLDRGAPIPSGLDTPELRQAALQNAIDLMRVDPAKTSTVRDMEDVFKTVPNQTMQELAGLAMVMSTNGAAEANLKWGAFADPNNPNKDRFATVDTALENFVGSDPNKLSALRALAQTNEKSPQTVLETLKKLADPKTHQATLDGLQPNDPLRSLDNADVRKVIQLSSDSKTGLNQILDWYQTRTPSLGVPQGLENSKPGDFLNKIGDWYQAEQPANEAYKTGMSQASQLLKQAWVEQNTYNAQENRRLTDLDDAAKALDDPNKPTFDFKGVTKNINSFVNVLKGNALTPGDFRSQAIEQLNGLAKVDPATIKTALDAFQKGGDTSQYQNPPLNLLQNQSVRDLVNAAAGKPLDQVVNWYRLDLPTKESPALTAYANQSYLHFAATKGAKFESEYYNSTDDKAITDFEEQFVRFNKARGNLLMTRANQYNQAYEDQTATYYSLLGSGQGANAFDIQKNADLDKDLAMTNVDDAGRPNFDRYRAPIDQYLSGKSDQEKAQALAKLTDLSSRLQPLMSRDLETENPIATRFKEFVAGTVEIFKPNPAHDLLEQLAKGQPLDLTRLKELDPNDSLRMLGDENVRKLVGLSLQDKRPIERLVDWYKEGSLVPGSYIQAIEMDDVKTAGKKQKLDGVIAGMAQFLATNGNNVTVPDEDKIKAAIDANQAAQELGDPVRLRMQVAHALGGFHATTDPTKPFEMSPSGKTSATTIEALLKEANQMAQGNSDSEGSLNLALDRSSLKTVADYLKAAYTDDSRTLEITDSPVGNYVGQALQGDAPLAQAKANAMREAEKALQGTIDKETLTLNQSHSQRESAMISRQIDQLNQAKQDLEKSASILADPVKGQLFLMHHALVGGGLLDTMPAGPDNIPAGLTDLAKVAGLDLSALYLSMNGRGADAAKALDSTVKFLQTHDLDQPYNPKDPKSKPLSIADVVANDDSQRINNLYQISQQYMPDNMKKVYDAHLAQGERGAQIGLAALTTVVFAGLVSKTERAALIDKWVQTNVNKVADETIAKAVGEDISRAVVSQIPRTSTVVGASFGVGTSFGVDAVMGGNNSWQDNTKWAFAGVAPIVAVKWLNSAVSDGAFSKAIAATAELRRTDNAGKIIEASFNDQFAGQENVTVGQFAKALKAKGLNVDILEKLDPNEKVKVDPIGGTGPKVFNSKITAQFALENSGALDATFGKQLVNETIGRQGLAARTFDALGRGWSKWSEQDVLRWAEEAGPTGADGQSRQVTVGAANGLFKGKGAGTFYGNNTPVFAAGEAGTPELQGAWHDLAADPKYQSSGSGAENPIQKGLSIIADHVHANKGTLDRVQLMNALRDPAVLDKVSEGAGEGALKDIQDLAFKVDPQGIVMENGLIRADVIRGVPGTGDAPVNFVLPSDAGFRQLTPADAKVMIIGIGDQSVKGNALPLLNKRGQAILLGAADTTYIDQPVELSKSTLTGSQWLKTLQENGASPEKIAEVQARLSRYFGAGADDTVLVKDGAFVGDAKNSKVKLEKLGFDDSEGKLSVAPKYTSALPSGMRTGSVTAEQWLTRLEQDHTNPAQLQEIRKALYETNHLKPDDVLLQDGAVVARLGQLSGSPPTAAQLANVGLVMDSASGLARDPKLAPFTYDQLLTQVSKAGVDPASIQVTNAAWTGAKKLSELSVDERSMTAVIGDQLAKGATLTGDRQALIMLVNQTGMRDLSPSNLLASVPVGIGRFGGMLVSEAVQPVTTVPYRAAFGDLSLPDAGRNMVNYMRNLRAAGDLPIKAADSSVQAAARNRLVATGFAAALPIATSAAYAFIDSGARDDDGNPRQEDFMAASGIPQSQINAAMAALKPGQDLFAAAKELGTMDRGALEQAEALSSAYPRFLTDQLPSEQIDAATGEPVDRLNYAIKFAKLDPKSLPSDYAEKLAEHHKQHADSHFRDLGSRFFNSTFYSHELQSASIVGIHNPLVNRITDSGTAFLGSATLGRHFLGAGAPAGAFNSLYWRVSFLDLGFRAAADFTNTYLGQYSLKQQIEQAKRPLTNETLTRRTPDMKLASDPAKATYTMAPPKTNQTDPTQP